MHAFFTGSLLIETIFSLDGLGLLGFESVLNRDYPVVFATLFIFSLIGVVVNLISDLTYTWIDPRIDFERRKALAASGSVSGDELTSAENALRMAEAALEAARANQIQAAATREAAIGSLKANVVLTRNTTVQTNPEVANAQARLDQARVDLERTVIRAPVDGVVTRRQVQVGQRVQAGSQLMSIVPVAEVYVDANFKEIQLRNVREGQLVTLTSDLYGSEVEFKGRVVGLSGGTGSAFALVPSQNATGNWIKVVQRLPVRIALDKAELEAHPLRVGLSMNVTIDTRASH